MTLVACAVALAISMLVWQAVSAEALYGLAWVSEPMNRVDSESSNLLMVGGLLIGMSWVARRLRPKPRPNGERQPAGPTHDAIRTPSL